MGAHTHTHSVPVLKISTARLVSNGNIIGNKPLSFRVWSYFRKTKCNVRCGVTQFPGSMGRLAHFPPVLDGFHPARHWTVQTIGTSPDIFTDDDFVGMTRMLLTDLPVAP